MAHPDIFYKYTSANTALIVLRNMRLRWSSPSIFDDPAEFRRMPRFEPSVQDAARTYPELLVRAAIGEVRLQEQDLIPNSRWLLEMVRKLIGQGIKPKDLIRDLGNIPDASDEKIEERLREFFNDQFISTARVICVAPEYDNDALWVSYADHFKGCVLGFKHIPSLSTPFLAAQRVTYSEHLPTVGSGMDLLLYGGTDGLKRATLDAVCFTKKHHWSYQREWRAVTWRPEEGEATFGDYKFYPEELESVTLGSDASAETEVSVADVLRAAYPHCILFRLSNVNGVISREQIALHPIGA